MPSPIISGDIIQVVFRTIVQEQTCLNVLHFKITQPVGQPSFTSDMELLFTCVDPATAGSVGQTFRSAIATNATIQDITLQRVSPTRDFYMRFPIGLAGISTVGECTATNVSGVITKQSEKPGRGRSGSFHIPGIGQNGYSAGRLTNAYRAEILPLQDALKEDLIDPVTSDHLGVPGMFHPSAPLGQQFQQVVATSIQSTLRVMRRRTVGVGI